MKTIAIIEDDLHIGGRICAKYEEGKLNIILEI